MTVVYLDAFLVLNFVVNYLLLACAGKLDGEPVGRGRTALAAALGAAYGGLALLPDWGFLEHPVCKAGAAVLMLLSLIHIWGGWPSAAVMWWPAGRRGACRIPIIRPARPLGARGASACSPCIWPCA